jgi:predicted DCC family thiol-disulfide oxidoreductase YuxK
MLKIGTFINSSFDKKIDGTGLAIFRITYAIVLLCEIAQMYYFRNLIFDKIPYLELAEIKFAIPIVIWFISVLFILFGAFTRWAAVINYLFSLTLIGSITSYEYHIFYVYMGINFLLIFVPISQNFSLDRLFQKLKYSNTTFQYTPTKNVSQFFYFILLFVGIGLVYFDSFFVKLDAYSWLHGLGMWMPSSFPMMVINDLTPFLNMKWLMYLFGYITLLLEFFFIFLFFRKKFRVIIFFIGLLLHLGILMIFPIPWFALAVISIYLLLIPISFWQKIFNFKSQKTSLTFYYDAQCPLCIRAKIIISHLDWFKKIDFKTVQLDALNQPAFQGFETEKLLNDIHSVNIKGKVFYGVDTYIQVFKNIFYLYPLGLILQLPGIKHFAKKIYIKIAKNRYTERCNDENCGYYPPNLIKDEDFKILQNFSLYDLKKTFFKLIVAFITFSQLLIIYNSPIINNLMVNLNFDKNIIHINTKKIISQYTSITRTFLGLTNHNVFYDKYHYEGYNHIISVVYYDEKNNNEIWLPLIDKNGQPGLYNYGTNWRKMSFSTNSPNIKEEALNSGIRDFTAFWAHKNNVDLINAIFLVKVKKLDVPNGWEKDFLKRQIQKPWIDGGYIKWENNKFKSFIKDIEKL